MTGGQDMAWRQQETHRLELLHKWQQLPDHLKITYQSFEQWAGAQTTHSDDTTQGKRNY